MAISLKKGGNVSLTKTTPGLKKIFVGLGWDARTSDGAAFDLDASLFMTNESGKVRSNDDFIFFNNLTSKCGSVEHMSDNVTGIGEGDDEIIRINLSLIPADIARLSVTVTIYDADTHKQNFGMVSRAFIRVVNEENGQEIARYDLSEDYSMETTMVFGEIYRHGGEWKFKAVGQGYAGGLDVMAQQFGISL
jgi:tellurium resistance protein TerD